MGPPKTLFPEGGLHRNTCVLLAPLNADTCKSSSVTSTSPSISVVIPVYRAELILPELCKRLVTSLSALSGSYQIILVDDRSPDRSWDVVLRMVEAYPCLTAIRLSRNFGQHYAVTAGLDLANGDWTVIMDCDLQDQPEEIGRLLEKAEQGYDVALARRAVRSDSSGRRLSSRLFYWLFNVLSGYRMDPAVGSFRIMRRSVVEAYRTMRESARLFGGLVEWLGFETTFVDVAHSARYEGRSSYNFRAMTKLALDGIFAFSNRPLYFSIGAGIIMSVLAAGFGVSMIVYFLVHPLVGVPGWLSQVTLTTFIGGLILLNLGILGVYVGRIYDQTKGRPLYVVDKIVAHRTGQGFSAGTK
jgi:polyisoprenyl-phosphate glycosyltransferase